MSAEKSNSGLLTIIAIVVIAILGFVVYNTTKESPEEQVAESVADTVDDIGEAVTGQE